MLQAPFLFGPASIYSTAEVLIHYGGDWPCPRSLAGYIEGRPFSVTKLDRGRKVALIRIGKEKSAKFLMI